MGTIFFYLLRQIATQTFLVFMSFFLLVALSQVLRLTEILVTFGVSPENFLLPFLYITVPFLSIITPLSYGTAVFLTFRSLAYQGELMGMAALGISPSKLLRPVAFLGLILTLGSTYSSLHWESWGRREFVKFFQKKTQESLEKSLLKAPPKTFIKDMLGHVLYMENINSQGQGEKIFFSPHNKSPFWIMAPRGHFHGSLENQDLGLTFEDGWIFNKFKKNQDVILGTFKKASFYFLADFQEKLLALSPWQDHRSYPFSELKKRVFENSSEEENRKLAYLYYNRWWQSFLTLPMGFLGFFLGNYFFPKKAMIIFNFLILFLYSLLGLSRWFVEEIGILPPLVGASLPVLIMLLIALKMWRSS